MPRQPRLFYDHVPQHVIQRGNNRQPCFFADSDRHLYLKMLSEASRANSCAVHAYVLMSNHVHLLVTASHACNIPKMMQTLGRRYVYYINKTYKRSGTLWEGRYKACLVGDPRYVLTCYRYIELNPVRANLCSWPGGYRWSSFRVGVAMTLTPSSSSSFGQKVTIERDGDALGPLPGLPVTNGTSRVL